MSEPVRKQDDSPEVAVLRKCIRGEPLTPEEQTLLQGATRKPGDPDRSISQEQLAALLAAKQHGE